MSAKTTVTMPPQRSLVVDLNKIMDIPLPNLLEEDDNEKKLCSPNDGASVGGGSSGGMGGVSVPLPPTPWNKIPYDGDNFHLEYIDLDKFLLENGIPASLEEELQSCLGEGTAKGVKGSITLLTPRELDEGGGDMSVGSPCVSLEGGSDGEGEVGCVAPAPEEVDVEVNFQPDPADLAMSSVPGGELFNPRKHRFSQEDLKPQPMIKKAKKVFVPDAQKDDKYWSRRKKNNVAAKRSRSARRLKENQITVRACFLERENSALRQEVAELRRGYGLCKSAASRYQAKYGLLQ